MKLLTEFKIGDFAVFPGHGVGKICEIQNKEIAPGKISSYFLIRLKETGPRILVPVDRSDKIRHLSTVEEIQALCHFLTLRPIPLDTSTWNRRSREYAEKMRTGTVLDLADVYRGLRKRLQERKTLSYAEKKVFKSCQDLLADEMALVLQIDAASANQKIEACFLDQ